MIWIQSCFSHLEKFHVHTAQVTIRQTVFELKLHGEMMCDVHLKCKQYTLFYQWNNGCNHCKKIRPYLYYITFLHSRPNMSSSCYSARASTECRAKWYRSSFTHEMNSIIKHLKRITLDFIYIIRIWTWIFK